MTIKDSSRKIYASAAKTNLKAGESLSVEYFGAINIGENEYISAMILRTAPAISSITDTSHIITKVKAARQTSPFRPTLQTAAIPWKLFSEQCNGDYKTDYAGEFRNISFTVKNKVNEQFTLTAGDRYYFDLSSLGIPGTANDVLPDKTMHYVPFTYVGTVDAYALKDETDTDTTSYEHSLFIADYNVKCSLQRETLAEMNLIYGQTYTASNVNYTLRAPSVGDHHRNEGEGSGLAPIDNEWDTIYQKSADYIKNWYKMRSFGQDIGTGNVEGMYLSRGGHFAAQATFWARPTLPERDIGFRPVLELPTDLAADSLKAVALIMAGYMPGEQQNWINIIVKKGEQLQSARCRGSAPPGQHFGRCTTVVGRRKLKLLQARRYRSRRCFGTYRFMGRLRVCFWIAATARSRSHRTIIPIFSATGLPPLFCLRARTLVHLGIQ